MVQYIGTAATSRRRRRLSPVGSAHEGTLLGRLDWVLLLTSAALVGYGLWAIAGITKHTVLDDPSYYLTRQVVFAVIGAVVIAAAIAIDPDWYRRRKGSLYAVMLGLMTLVFLVGTVSRGSTRWIDLSIFRFQPSEFGRLLLILFLAALLADRAEQMDDLRTPLLAVALALPPIALVFAEPDLGSALVYIAALAGCLFIGGIRWSHVVLLGGVAAVAIVSVLWLLPAGGIHVLQDYQVKRLTSFTSPDSDPSGTTYNQHQSKIAVGAGGMTGRGPSGSTQTNLDYIPEHETDFAFASFAEQRGFLGVSVLLLLYLLVIWRGLKIVTIARDGFSAIIAGGIVFSFLFQVFVNVGMTIGLAPVTGITLPFVSVGGSSMVASLAAIGVLQSIHARGGLRRG